MWLLNNLVAKILEVEVHDRLPRKCASVMPRRRKIDASFARHKSDPGITVLICLNFARPSLNGQPNEEHTDHVPRRKHSGSRKKDVQENSAMLGISMLVS